LMIIDRVPLIALGHAFPGERDGTERRMIAALQPRSGLGRFCCKSQKLPGDDIPAMRRSERRPLIRVPSIELPRSSASLSSGDEVPHIFTRKSRLQPGDFLITSAKRLLQQNRHIPAATAHHDLGVGGSNPSERATKSGTKSGIQNWIGNDWVGIATNVRCFAEQTLSH
jgi:hypothetical protein